MNSTYRLQSAYKFIPAYIYILRNSLNSWCSYLKSFTSARNRFKISKNGDPRIQMILVTEKKFAVYQASGTMFTTRAYIRANTSARAAFEQGNCFSNKISL